MFLDDELEAIYTTNGFNPQTSFRLLQACLKRIPKPDTVRPQDFLNEIHKIEGGWKLFCKKHSEFKPEGFKEFMIDHCKLEDDRVLEYLHWK